MKLCSTVLCVATAAALSAGCATDGGPAPAMKAAAPLAAPTASSCPPDAHVQISQITPGGGGGTIAVDPGKLHVGKQPATGVRWSLPGPASTYAFTADGVTFAANPPPGGSGAPSNGGSDFTWCMNTSGADASWYYTLKFTVSTPAPAKTWTCDPTIVNFGSRVVETAPVQLNCHVQ